MGFGGGKNTKTSLVIAASDTSADLKIGADFICDGIADELEIRAAINRISNLSNPLTHYGGNDHTAVIPDINFAEIWHDGTLYHAYGGDKTYANIMHSTSVDGYVWSAAVSVMALGTAGQWDDSQIGVSTVWQEGATVYMLYRGNGLHVGLATATSLSGPFTRYVGNPVITESIAQDPAGLIKVGSIYVLYTNTTGGDREVNVYTSTDLHVWTRQVGSPAFTGGRYCSCPVYYNSLYYLFVSRYYDGMRGGVIEVYSCPTYLFQPDRRTFKGIVIFDPVRRSVDTPTIPTTNIQRTTFPAGTFKLYYSKDYMINGLADPCFLVEDTSFDSMLTKVVKPGEGVVTMLEGTYNISDASSQAIDIPWGITLESRNATLKLTAGSTKNMQVPGMVLVDTDSVLAGKITIDGNDANVVSGIQYGLVLAGGGVVENATVQNFNGYGVWCRGLFKGKVRRNNFGVYAYGGGVIDASTVAGNGLTTGNPAVSLGNQGKITNSIIKYNKNKGILFSAGTSEITNCDLSGNDYWGFDIVAGATGIIKGSKLQDNAGYSGRGQGVIAGKLCISDCTLNDQIITNTNQMYFVAGSAGQISNCNVKGGSGTIYVDAGATVTQVNVLPIL